MTGLQLNLPNGKVLFVEAHRDQDNDLHLHLYGQDPGENSCPWTEDDYATHRHAVLNFLDAQYGFGDPGPFSNPQQRGNR